jgi:dienelactone hydrolase
MKASPLLASLVTAPVVVLLLLTGARGARAGDFERIEKVLAEERIKLVKIWLDLANDLAERDLKAPAVDAVSRARAVDVEGAGLAETAKRVEALAGKGTEDDAARKRIDKARKDAAKEYDKMAAMFDTERQDLRHQEYLSVALGLDPSKPRVKFVSDMAKKEPFLLRSATHPFAGLVSLPETWKPGKVYPVLVAVEGEAAAFPASNSHFRDARGKREWIVVTPHSLTSSDVVTFDKYPAYGEARCKEWNDKRMEFDEPGLLALLDMVRDVFGGAPKVAITGFSRGGYLAYRMLLRHPDRFLAGVAACARYDQTLADGAEPVAGGGPPVWLLTAGKDPFATKPPQGDDVDLTAQTDQAEKALADHGFSHVTRTNLADAERSDLAGEVVGLLEPSMKH